MASSGGGLIGGLIGAVIGFFVGGPTGAYYGFVAGSMVGSLVDPAVVDGPRLGDLKVQNASYGISEPICYGGDRLGGNLLWTTDLVEHESEGGKGGPSVNNFTYTVSCGINICAGPVESLRRIWADSKLVYDATEDATDEAKAASAAFAEFFAFYQGTETQDPDPTIEAAVGVGNCPAYLGSCYIVFTDIPLVDYGNRIPSFTFEISTETQGAVADPPSPVTDLSIADGAGLNHGTAILTWGAAAGATSYDIYRSVNGGAFAVFASNQTSPFGDNLTSTFVTGLGDIYNYYVMAVNAGGETPGNQEAIRYMGTIGGSGSFTSGQWSEQCFLYWYGDGSSGYYGVGNPGAQTFGNFCYRYIGGSYGGAQANTDATLEHAGSVAAPEALSTIGVVPAGSAILGDIVSDICVRSGLTVDQIDVDQLSDIVDGYIVTKQMPGRRAIDPLRQAYYFDAVETDTVDGDSILRFVKRGAAPVVSITAEDLAAGENEAEEACVVPLRAQETDLPSRINVSYIDKDRDFETGTQTSRRMTTGSQQVTSVELPIVMSSQKAREVAEVLMYDAWTSRNQRSWSTTKKYTKHEPTDVWEINDGEFDYVVRATEKSEEGSIIRWKGVDEEPSAYSPDVQAAIGSGTSIIRFIGAAGVMRLEVIDCPIIRDADTGPGYYVAGGGYTDSWSSGKYYQSIDGGTTYVAVKDISTTATMGDAQTVLADYRGGNTPDEVSAVTVKLTSGTLSSITRAQLYNGGNLAWLQGELIQFQRADLIAEGTYLLTGLLRGRKGTEQYMGTHAVFDHFVLMDAAVSRVVDPLSNINLPTKVKGVTTGRSVAGATAADFTNTGASIKPLSVASLKVEDAGGGDFNVAWTRRTSIGGEWRDLVDVPLGETTEQYSVEVERSAAVISTATVTTNAATVAAISGDIVRVYQLSDVAGRGFPTEIELA